MLNGRKSQIGKVVVLVRGRVTGWLHARTNRLGVFTQSSRRSLAVKLIKVARNALEVLLGGISGV